MATYVKNQLYMVPLAELQPDPTQPRKYIDPENGISKLFKYKSSLPLFY